MSTGFVNDLNAGAPTSPVETDLCILGAGPVGLALARGLAEKGRRVTILEIGGPTSSSDRERLPIRFDGRVYRGATVGRAFGLGGTSALWGGQILPLRPADLLARPQAHAPAWPIAYSDLQPYIQQLQEILGFDGQDFDLASLRSHSHPLRSLDFSGWTPRLSRWLAFRKRNLAVAWDARFRQRPGVSVWVNADTQGWQVSRIGGKAGVRELVAKSPNGTSLRVQPAAVAIASGALESARTLLELDEQEGPLGGGVREFTGRFLHDHLSLRIGRLLVADKEGFEERFAPFFEGPTMRSLRMELPPEALSSAGLPALYVHFIAVAPENSGFAVARDCLRFAQRRNISQAAVSALKIPAALPDITRLAYARIAKQRLSFPRNTEYFLHIDLEQAPRSSNRIYLGASEGGRHRPAHIDWNIYEDAPRISHIVRRFFEDFWTRNALNRIGTLDFDDDAEGWDRNVYDLYHPAGTTRMAADSAAGVVDLNLKVHGTDNVFVAGSSVFPSMGAANPTFTAMALALRLANYIHDTGNGSRAP